jgi:predicted RecA/RadA family phage recombinase
MSAKFDKIADRIDYTPSGGVDSGEVVGVGGLIGVALEDIAANALGTLAIAGQFELDLASSKTFSAGDAVYVDSSEATDTGTFFGYAVAGSDATTGTVKAVLVQSAPAEES